MTSDDILNLQVRRQQLGRDAQGHANWQILTTQTALPAGKTAILICDVWDKHWSRGATERVEAMVSRMNEVVCAARSRGIQILHAPSDTMSFYAGTPARQRLIDAPHSEPPSPRPHPDPALPIDDSDGGSDTGEPSWYTAWSRQHPAIEIDQQVDGISDDGQEIYNLIRARGIEHVLMMGVHTNMCILNRSFAIKALVRWGIDVMLVRDLTDAMYNPAMPPYVSHREGTQLVVAYIEKFWCPTAHSRDIL